MKDNQHVEPIIALDERTVTFRFAFGLSELVFHLDKCSDAIKARASLVGMAQVRLVDAAAIGRADKEGNIIPERQRVEMKHERIAALIEHYESGTEEWTLSGGGSGAPSAAITLQAIARVKSVTMAEAEGMVKRYADKTFEGDTRKCLAFLREGAEVAQAILDIKREGIKTNVNADDALDELVNA